VGLTRSWSVELAPRGIRVNAVCPGWTRSALLQQGLDNGTLELDRLRSWRKLQRELLAIAARKDVRLRAQLKKRWVEAGRAGKAAAARKRGG
jgi:ribosome biogenesis GTPase